MSVIVKSSGGGGLSKSRVLTDEDIIMNTNFGTMIESTTLQTTVEFTPYGGGYYDVNKHLCYVFGNNPNGMCIRIYNFNNDNISLEKTLSLPMLPIRFYNLKSDENSNVIVLSCTVQSGTTDPIIVVNKETLTYFTLNHTATHHGVSVFNNCIYVASSVESVTWMYEYDQNGNLIRKGSMRDDSPNQITSGICLDKDKNLYYSISNTIVSLTNDYTLRWKINVTSVANLVGVTNDGLSFVRTSNHGTNLYLIESNSNIVKAITTDDRFEYRNTDIHFGQNKSLIWLPSSGGSLVYYYDDQLTLVGQLVADTSHGYGHQVIAFTDNEILRFGKSSYNEFYVKKYNKHNIYVRR